MFLSYSFKNCFYLIFFFFISITIYRNINRFTNNNNVSVPSVSLSYFQNSPILFNIGGTATLTLRNHTYALIVSQTLRVKNCYMNINGSFTFQRNKVFYTHILHFIFITSTWSKQEPQSETATVTTMMWSSCSFSKKLTVYLLWWLVVGKGI